MYQRFIKRVFDILFSVCIMPVVLVVMVPVAIAIKVEDGGPVFFCGERLGRDMKRFRMFKFRTMKVNAPDIRNSDGTTFNSATDSRVTRVGNFLRKTSIDELPQFLNVFIGDMSMIGPRPSPLGNKDMYPKEFFKKYEVKPGITGLNQAVLRNSATMDQRIENDAFYSDNISFIFDVKIFFMTISSVLLKKNINKN